MTISDFRFAFRILGGCYEARRLVDAAAAFAAYAAADPKAEVTHAKPTCRLSASALTSPHT